MFHFTNSERPSDKAIKLFMEFMRLDMSVRTIEFQPRHDRGLYALRSTAAATNTVRVRCDQAIAPYVLVNHHWEIETIMFARDVIMRYPGCVVIDVGANMGLFSRQLLGWCNGISRLFAYDPDPDNFTCLTHNLACFPEAVMHMVGLAAQDGQSILHIDAFNCGNSSLMSNGKEPDDRFKTITIQLKDIVQESRHWIASGLPIFYKSDTQGYDEYLASLLPDDVCEKMIGGILEIEDSQKPDLDMARFRRFLDLFPNKIRLGSTGQSQMTTEDIVSLMEQRGERGSNIGFFR